MRRFITVFLMVSTHIALGQWTQLGLDLDGEAAGDRSGKSVSLNADGTILAIGAYTNQGGGFGAGHVRVYQYSGASWVQLGSDINGEAANDQSGYSVSLNSAGNILAIGAPQNDGGGNNGGHVRVYQYNGANWVQIGTDINAQQANQFLGWSVSLNDQGNRVAIGIRFYNVGASILGGVRSFEYNGVDWVQIGNNISGPTMNGQFGYSVGMNGSGNILVAGAPNANADLSGQTRVYQLNGASWSLLGGSISGEAANDNSGTAVSINSSGDIIAIGASGNDGAGSNSGHVRVYQYNGASWVQLGSDINGEAVDDFSGTSVSLNDSGTILAIGGEYNDGNGNAAGQVRIYQFDGANWIQLGSDLDGEAANDNFGQSVSLNSNGDRIAIGTEFNDGNGLTSGHTRVFLNPDIDASIFVGSGSGQNNTTGSQNTFLGDNSGFSNTEGDNNTFAGYRSGYTNTAGSNNTYIGRSAGYTNQTGSGNVFLGHRSGYNETGSNRLYIDNSETATPLIWGDFSADALRINGSLRVTTISQQDALSRVWVSDPNGNLGWREATTLNTDNQNLSVINNGTDRSINISGGTGVNFSIADNDNEPANELQQLNFAGGVISLSNDPAATLIDLSNYDNDVTDDFNGDFATLVNIPAGLADGDDVNDADANPTNEIQDLALSGNILSLSGDVTTVNLSPYLDNTDNQTLSIVGSQLSISGGNMVNLPSLQDNLGNHSVQQDLLPAADNIYSLGAAGATFQNVYFNSSLFNNNLEFLHARGNNVALGYAVMPAIAAGSQNTGVGNEALMNATTGANNTAIGYRALQNNTSGTFNTAMGNNARTLANNLTNTTAIGNGALVTASNNVRIGNSSVTSIGGYTNWSNLSDGRFKKDIQEDIPGLDFVEKLRPVSYELDRKKLNTFLQGEDASEIATSSKERLVGFVAQEVEQIVTQYKYVFSGVDKPQNEHSHYGLRYAEFVVPLTKAIQELSALVKYQQERITKLETLIYGTQSTAEPTPKTDFNTEGFVLYQNIPNPFNQITQIAARIPEDVQQAKIVVYNLQGLELASYPLKERGTVSVEISGRRFPSGMYLYALVADGKVIDTKKMILTK